MLHHPSDQPIHDDDDPMGGPNEGDGSGDEGEDEDDGDVSMRDRIARQMWDDYVELLHARGLGVNNGIDADDNM